MTEIPYLLLAKVTLASNGQGTFTYPVPQGQTLTLREMYFSSTGAFSVIGLYDANGINYSNVSSSAGIPSTVLASGANNNNALKDLIPDLVVVGGNQINLLLLDTSGSGNTVNFVFNGSKTLAG